MSENLKELYASVDWSGTDFAERHDRLAESVLSLLGELPGKRVLDLGCGSATLAVELAERGFNVVGLDVVIEPARRRVAARGVLVTLVEQDMAEMTFSEEFDAAVNWDVSGIGLLPTDEANIDIVRRVRDALVPGGKFLIETYNPLFVREHKVEGLEFDEASGRFVSGVSRTLADGGRKTWDVSIRLFTLEEWRSIFRGVGLEFAGAWGNKGGGPWSSESKMLVLLGRR